MDSFEIEYTADTDHLILGQKSRRCWQNKKRFFIALFVLVLLSSCVAVAISYSKGTGKNFLKEHRVCSALPNSFSATFEIHDSTVGKTNGYREFEISWNKVKEDLRYREKYYFDPLHRESSFRDSGDSLLTASLTIVGKITTFKLNNIDFNDTACDVRESTEWHAVVKTMLHNDCENITSSKCPGNMWKAKMNPIVRFCVEDSRLLFIRYKQFKAILVKWRTPADDDAIPLPLTGAKCNGDSISDEKKLKTHALPLKARSVNMKGRKTCLFVHGTGNDIPRQGYHTLSEYEYWGQIQHYIPQCDSHKFIKFDTVNHGWNDPILHDMFCEFAGSTKSNGKLINDKIMYSHSFGNLVIAAALKNGVCEIDKATTSWFSVQAPWRGSKEADIVKKICECVFGWVCDIPFGRELMKYINKVFNYCDGRSISKSYKTLQTNYKSPVGLTFQDLIETAKTQISGALCGVSAWGMGKDWSRSMALLIIQYIASLENPNDGMVSLASCRITGDFKDTYESRFYQANVNHEDGTCRFDEDQSSDERPCSWYGEMAKNAISRR